MDDYLNALNPMLEQSVDIKEVNNLGSVETIIYSLDGEGNSGSIEIEEKK